jgi:queuine tRNA-ribosyltransferase
LLLSFRPGVDVVEKFGGLHKFMNFDKTIFTDCGGFQMIRDGIMNGVGKKGISFLNPYSKQKIILTPKKIMQIQMSIKSDVAMMLDDLSPYGSTREQFLDSLKNTHEWAEESLKHHTDDKQLLFGIVQGGFETDLRKLSAKFVSNLDFDGIALGGLAIGEPKKLMYKAINACYELLPKEKPHYVMGVGSPEDLLECIGKGFDCFDSVYPTMNARHNSIFTKKGKISIDKAKFAFDQNPLDKDCDCYVCKNYSTL